MVNANITALDVLLRTQGMTHNEAVRWLGNAGEDVAETLIEAYGEDGAGRLSEINAIVRPPTEINKEEG